MVPEELIKVLEEEKKNLPIDECDVCYEVKNKRFVIGHYKEISQEMVNVINANSVEILENLKQHIPMISHFGTMWYNDKFVSRLEMELPREYNKLDDINDVADAATHVHYVLLKALRLNSVLDNVNKDLKKFYEKPNEPASKKGKEDR